MKHYIVGEYFEGTFIQFQEFVLQKFSYEATEERDIYQFAFQNDVEVQEFWLH